MSMDTYRGNLQGNTSLRQKEGVSTEIVLVALILGDLIEGCARFGLMHYNCLLARITLTRFSPHNSRSGTSFS